MGFPFADLETEIREFLGEILSHHINTLLDRFGDEELNPFVQELVGEEEPNPIGTSVVELDAQIVHLIEVPVVL